MVDYLLRRFRAGSGLLVIACATASAQGSRLDNPSRPIEEQLVGKTVIAGRTLPIALELRVVGGRLVTIHLPPASPIEIRSFATGALLSSVGTWGPGDFDFIGLWHLDPVPNTEKVWVWDLTRHRMVLLDVGDSVNSHPALSNWLVVRADAALTSPAWVGDYLYSPGFFRTGRLAEFKRDGNFTQFLGDAPQRPDAPTEPTIATQQAYVSVMHRNMTGTLFAVASRYAGRLEILKRDGSLVARAAVPVAFEPAYRVVKNKAGEVKVAKDSSARVGYLDLAVDSQYVYALFSGRRDADSGMYAAGQSIHVFGWDGKLKGLLTLPAPANTLALDEQSGRFVAMHPTPVPSLAVYDNPFRSKRSP
jgi:hypothetical protein